MQKLFFLLTLVTGIVARAQTQQPANIGYADTEYIMAQMPEMKQLEEQLKATQTKLQSDFTAKRQQFQKEYSDYAANVNTLSDTARVSTEKKLQQLSAELQQLQQDAETTLENTRKLWMAPVYLKVGKAIEEVAAENGFSIILPRRVGGLNLLLYFDKKRDVSGQVLQKLGITPEPAEK